MNQFLTLIFRIMSYFDAVDCEKINVPICEVFVVC